MAVISLGLGIGANAAIFSLMNALLIRSLPVLDPERLVYITSSASFFTFQQFRANSREEFEDITAMAGAGKPGPRFRRRTTVRICGNTSPGTTSRFSVYQRYWDGRLRKRTTIVAPGRWLQ